MFQRRSHRSAPRTRSLALGGALAALAVVGGGTVVAVSAPTEVAAGDIRLAQNAAAQQMELGAPVDLDLEPVVARAAGGTIPQGTTIQVTGLPDGLVQNGWVISGTPSRAGEYEVLVTVSNSGVSQSQKVAITVTEEPGPAAARAAAPAVAGADAEEEAAEGETAEGESTEGEGTTTTTPSAADGPQVEPTLSATPGVPPQDEESEEGTSAGTSPGTSPDLCSVLGDGDLDGSSLTQLLPVLTGDDDSASNGLLLVLVNAVVSMLPSVLGDSGSLEGLGSAGQILCTLQPSLFGGQPADGTAGATGDENLTGGATAAAGAGDQTSGGTTTGATAPGLDPSALLGLLTTGAGSLG